MNAPEIISLAVSSICAVIMAVLAWVTIYRVNSVNVSFAGRPLDKTDFEKHEETQRRDNFKIWQKMEMDHKEESNRVAAVEGDIKGIKSTTEMISQQLSLLSLKLDGIKGK